MYGSFTRCDDCALAPDAIDPLTLRPELVAPAVAAVRPAAVPTIIDPSALIVFDLSILGGGGPALALPQALNCMDKSSPLPSPPPQKPPSSSPFRTHGSDMWNIRLPSPPPQTTTIVFSSATIMTDSRDLISALPDDVLHLLLSFLPADEAVRTCVLAQRWRDLWRSARAVRITQSARAVRTTYRGKVNWTRRSLTNFLNHLLLLRAAGSPMDEIEISCGRLRGDTCYDEHYPCSCYEDRDGPSPRDIAEAEDLSRSAGMWIRHALSICKARALNVSYRYSGRLRLGGVPFVSTQLTKAVFSWASFKSDRLDFSMCPALEDLTTRTRISTPRVVSLDISVNTGRAPVIESMPSLEPQRAS
ncbi:hypothetical protein HU200_064844 [Digitaria exilis]|uniref:F-box domain-containing protein n=1 Tax=Digitaria exilis TaxID=1010633 RepID=A0A835A4M3_9POAL|nr:hypothetical protein HU200_064844 [Digitaria exilis]